jgi:hypothetical protein
VAKLFSLQSRVKSKKTASTIAQVKHLIRRKMNKNIDFNKLVNSNTACRLLELNKKESKVDYKGKIIGLEEVFEPKDWHRWVYGGDRNPNY